ncbi:MAG: glycoside hydrolase family 32 protein [Oscillospiraceae bacterium]|nr:glycoside hydrolase family 32 protein [Oscillospiraceae bacterium]
MDKRLKYHFEPKKGWINDPNGLIFYKRQYHAFFQHYPYAPKWGQMHWGHAVSDDLIRWKELPIALYPDKPYDDGERGGCWSGSAVIKDDLLYLFYTSVSDEFGQTQSVAMSKDGLHFEKYENNPVIKKYPPDGSCDFRDPKVTKIGGIYYMVCGSGKDNIGKILLFSSENLFDWQYVGVLFEGEQYGSVLECPDFFPFDDKYMLMFSQMGRPTHSTMFIYGDFDGKVFAPVSFHTPEAGPHFYAPQTFADDKNRRIIIGWLNSWDRQTKTSEDYTGAFTIPRELKMVDGKLYTFPVSEASDLLKNEDELVKIEKNGLTATAKTISFPLEYRGGIERVDILKDTKTIEVFVNKGETSFTCWFADEN